MTVELNIENEIAARREQFALGFIRYIVWLAGALMIGEFIVWLLFPQYTQILAHVSVILPITITSWLYPVLYRAGYIRLGMILFHRCI
jgi:hypothetical protein